MSLKFHHILPRIGMGRGEPDDNGVVNLITVRIIDQTSKLCPPVGSCATRSRQSKSVRCIWPRDSNHCQTGRPASRRNREDCLICTWFRSTHLIRLVTNSKKP